jgi:hypothetical protein
MKQQLSSTILVISLFLLLSACRSAPPAANVYGMYEIECAGAASQGSQLVKVWVYGNDRSVSIDALKRYAVHGIIFKGYAGGNGCTSQRPMAANPVLEQQRANFFDPFFNRDRAYNKYTTQQGATFERKGSGKNQQIGATISVAKDMLRRDLEAAGILSGLSSGF